MKLAIVIVHYHTPELTKRAFHALARDAAATDLTLELVLVNNGSRPADLASLRSLPAAFVDPGRNLGYAGGANLGIRETSSDVVVVMNSDVQVLPGCLRSLAEVLESGAAAAGPSLGRCPSTTRGLRGRHRMARGGASWERGAGCDQRRTLRRVAAAPPTAVTVRTGTHI